MADRIRWEKSQAFGSILGFAGTHEPWMFQIWTGGRITTDKHDKTVTEPTGRWGLICQLPGYADERPESSDPEELKAAAEAVLARFVASLGAVFPESVTAGETPEVPGNG